MVANSSPPTAVVANRSRSDSKCIFDDLMHDITLKKDTTNVFFKSMLRKPHFEEWALLIIINIIIIYDSFSDVGKVESGLPAKI